MAIGAALLPIRAAAVMIGAGALLLTACADQRTTSDLVREIEVKAGTNVIVRSASGMPAGFYPGQKTRVVAYDRPKYDAYLSSAHPRIVTVASLQGAITRGEAKPGCIGEDVLTCMATLAQTLAVTTSSVGFTIITNADDPLLQQEKIAVDGKRIFEKTLRFSAYVPGQYEGVLPTGLSISVSLDSNQRIHAMIVLLPHNPMGAHTEQEYDTTGLFELLSAVGTRPCTVSKLDLYRTFEAQLKPSLKPGHSIEVDMSSASESYWQSGKLNVCGRKIDFSSSSGVSTTAISPTNMSGYTGGAVLQIE